MLFIVVALFCICWLPYQMYNILQEIYPDINRYEFHHFIFFLITIDLIIQKRYRYINLIWFSCHWLAMSNSCYNPFIYAIYSVSYSNNYYSLSLTKISHLLKLQRYSRSIE